MPSGYLLTAEAIRKLRQDHDAMRHRVRRLESLVSNVQPVYSRENSVLCKVTELITGRSGATLGKGAADIQDITTNDDDEATFEDAKEIKQYGGEQENRNIDIYNDSIVPIPVGSYIRVSRNFKSGLWMPVTATQTALAKSDGGISARSGDTAGSGTVSVFYVASDGTLTDTGENVSAYNVAGSAIAASVFITIKRVQGSSFWVIDMEDCG